MVGTRRVLMIEDSPETRRSVAKVLAGFAEFAKPKECDTTEEAWESLAHCRPELVILDLALPVKPGQSEGGDWAGFELASELVENCIELGHVVPHFLIYSQNRQLSARSHAQEKGYSLVVKGRPDSEARLVEALEAYLDGRTIVPGDDDTLDLELVLRALKLPEYDATIVRLFAAGRTDAQIADATPYTAGTVEDRRSKIGNEIADRLEDDARRPPELPAPTVELKNYKSALLWFLYGYVGIRSAPEQKGRS
jgi:DNA-binding NarL/FixJ family response regulator